MASYPSCTAVTAITTTRATAIGGVVEHLNIYYFRKYHLYISLYTSISISISISLSLPPSPSYNIYIMASERERPSTRLEGFKPTDKYIDGLAVVCPAAPCHQKGLAKAPHVQQATIELSSAMAQSLRYSTNTPWSAMCTHTFGTHDLSIKWHACHKTQPIPQHNHYQSPRFTGL